jgi:hypothetical protein
MVTKAVTMLSVGLLLENASRIAAAYDPLLKSGRRTAAILEAAFPVFLPEDIAATREAADVGLNDAEVRTILFPEGSWLAAMLRLSELQGTIEDLTVLRAVLERGRLSARACALLRQAIAVEGSHEQEYRRLARRLGVGPRRLSLPSNLGSLPPAQLQQLKIQRAGFVSERAIALYQRLASLMPLLRARKKGVYNEAALDLTARLVSAHYLLLGVRRLTANHIRSRLQKARQHISD